MVAEMGRYSRRTYSVEAMRLFGDQTNLNKVSSWLVSRGIPWLGSADMGPSFEERAGLWMTPAGHRSTLNIRFVYSDQDYPELAQRYGETKAGYGDWIVIDMWNYIRVMHDDEFKHKFELQDEDLLARGLTAFRNYNEPNEVQPDDSE